MAHRYEDIYAELIEAVPELGLTYGPDYNRRDWEWTMERANQPLSQEDRTYLLSIEVNSAHSPKTEEPLLYVLFESELNPWLVHYAQHSCHFARLAEIMNWLEELSRDGDDKTQNLVAIAICEGLIGNHSAALTQLLPLMGETMRQMCRDFVPFFRLNEETRALLLAPTKNTRRFAKRP